jgi:DNA uptake protein ComE-like DNA-binding protein
MRWMKVCLSAILGSLLFVSGCTSCTQQQSPDQIRRETADATAKLKQDTVAVAKGVKDGMTKAKTVDINTASKSDLTDTLGITDAQAAKIIASRPYDNTDQLVTKRAVTNAEYDSIRDKVTVKK